MYIVSPLISVTGYTQYNDNMLMKNKVLFLFRNNDKFEVKKPEYRLLCKKPKNDEKFTTPCDLGKSHIVF
jgi:hypothetical protein